MAKKLFNGMSMTALSFNELPCGYIPAPSPWIDLVGMSGRFLSTNLPAEGLQTPVLGGWEEKQGVSHQLLTAP